MEQKEIQIDIELQNRVLDKMFVVEALGTGVIKCSIPDEIFADKQNVEIDGKEYGIYEIPGVGGNNGSPKIIERAIDNFIKGYGDPSWSQVVTDVAEEESFKQLVSYPKTVYLKK